LSQGIVFGTSVACPLHNWTIGLCTGQAAAPDEGCTPRFEGAGERRPGVPERPAELASHATDSTRRWLARCAKQQLRLIGTLSP
jgi:nitrite reductase (NADH) small subunit